MANNTDAVTSPPVNRIIEHLWRPGEQEQRAPSTEHSGQPEIYAVLDGARNRRIEPMINNSKEEHACLYTGVTSYALKRAAPHLVRLDKTASLTRQLIEQGWGNSWGIFYRCNNPTRFSAIRLHCKKIAKAKGPGGESLVFRYYDPRVLRALLPLSSTAELQQLLGPSDALLLESEDGDALLEHTLDIEGRLTVRRLDLSE